MPQAPKDQPRIGTILNGRYRLGKALAAGSMGVVHRGERVELGRPVAVKFLLADYVEDSSFRKRFDREARAMAQLSHPNCVSVIDYGVEGMPYIVMELVHGITLRELIDRGPVPKYRTMVIVRQLLAGLAHAHKQGIIHRDIKPANVMLSEATGAGDHVRIFDFGLARLVQAAPDDTASSPGTVAGTPNYMAPELARGDAADERTDLYAIGVLLFELLTGQKPFLAEDPIQVLRKHRDQMPPRLSEIRPDGGFSDELEELVAKALAKPRNQRFQSAIDFSTALMAVPEAQISLEDHAQALGLAKTVPGGLPSAPRPVAHTPPPLRKARPSRARNFAAAAVMACTALTIAGWRVASGEPVLDPGEAVVPEPPAAAAVLPDVEPVVAERAVDPDDEAELEAEEEFEPSDERALAPAPQEASVSVTQEPHPDAGEPLHMDLTAEGMAQADDDRAAGDDDPEAGRSRQTPINQLKALMRAGKTEQAIRKVKRLRKRYPRSAYVAYLQGNLYFDKQWWTAGIERYKLAINLDRRFRRNRKLQKHAVKALGSDKSFSAARSLLLRQVGRPGLSAVRRAARQDRSRKVRRRAAAIARRLK